MAVQYNKLFKMLIDRKMSNNQLAKQAGISLNIITRLKRDEMSYHYGRGEVYRAV